MVDDAEKEAFKIITALDPRQVTYDWWVEELSKHMPEDEARRIAAELVDEAYDSVEGTE